MASGLIAVITLSGGGNVITMPLRYSKGRSNAALSRGETVHFELYFARLVVWFASVPPGVDAGPPQRFTVPARSRRVEFIL
ncbi:hypothetical protein SMATCC274_19330 [Serratia marcescens]|nr:hypothetical protein SMATCC274_19330 [Serratia marcescens]